MSATVEVNRLCDFTDDLVVVVARAAGEGGRCVGIITSEPHATTIEAILEVASEPGWQTIDDKDCCPSCYALIVRYHLDRQAVKEANP